MALSDLTGNKNEMKEKWEPMNNGPCSSLPRFWGFFLWIILGPIYLLIHGLMKRPLQIFAWQIKTTFIFCAKTFDLLTNLHFLFPLCRFPRSSNFTALIYTEIHSQKIASNEILEILLKMQEKLYLISAFDAFSLLWILVCCKYT